MSIAIRPTTTSASSTLRSIGAVAGALVVTALVTGVVDQILHWLGVFPPWGAISYAPVPYALAVTYRAIFGIGGGYLAARWAPSAPVRHAVWLGGMGSALSVAGVVAALTHDVGPVWYPVALLLLTFPTAWLGGTLYARRAAAM